MPFYAAKPDGGSSGPSTGGPVTMRVEPGKVLSLKARLEAVRNSVRDFLKLEGDSLRARPLAQDEVSVDAARIFAENADMALDVTKQFVDQLDLTIDQLSKIARTYNLAEDVNTTAMQQQNRGV
ncbi:PE domain-containing protein [Lentzea aerocolonigenes]|uniref:PE domain-containing protein n=1 Tax=Lentzea aerocolonigenes TaxID=68170 RepID=UPI000A467691|nr:PE domain-containing protein [Lentzea aerocolonigenes]MCP2246353.1 PE family protein [Lentzea aerocolonigenes]